MTNGSKRDHEGNIGTMLMFSREENGGKVGAIVVLLQRSMPTSFRSPRNSFR